jgi:hypothetical protein
MQNCEYGTLDTFFHNTKEDRQRVYKSYILRPSLPKLEGRATWVISVRCAERMTLTVRFRDLSGILRL